MYSSLLLVILVFAAKQVLSLDIQHTNGSSNLNVIQRSSVCYKNSQCYSFERCVANTCKCQPNYQNVSGSCVRPRTCGTWCNSNMYDRYRRCDPHGSCVCMNGYIEDPYTQVCSPQCIWDSDCRDGNAFCFSGECKCRSGFRKDAITGLCKSTFCYNDNDCYFNLHDSNTHCSFNKCVCDSHYYLDSSTQICTRQLNPWVWAWACIFVPLAIIICCIYCIRRRRHCHHSDVHVYRC